jgi:hypothetical protein
MSMRIYTAGAMRRASKPKKVHTPLPVYTVTRQTSSGEAVAVFTGTIGKVREFLGLNLKSARDALKFRLEQGVTDETALKAPTAQSREQWRLK